MGSSEAAHRNGRLPVKQVLRGQSLHPAPLARIEQKPIDAEMGAVQSGDTHSWRSNAAWSGCPSSTVLKRTVIKDGTCALSRRSSLLSEAGARPERGVSFACPNQILL